jgi:hypothetical protein
MSTTKKWIIFHAVIISLCAFAPDWFTGVVFRWELIFVVVSVVLASFAPSPEVDALQVNGQSGRVKVVDGGIIAEGDIARIIPFVQHLTVISREEKNVVGKFEVTAAGDNNELTFKFASMVRRSLRATDEHGYLKTQAVDEATASVALCNRVKAVMSDTGAPFSTEILLLMKRELGLAGLYDLTLTERPHMHPSDFEIAGGPVAPNGVLDFYLVNSEKVARKVAEWKRTKQKERFKASIENIGYQVLTFDVVDVDLPDGLERANARGVEAHAIARLRTEFLKTPGETVENATRLATLVMGYSSSEEISIPGVDLTPSMVGMFAASRKLLDRVNGKEEV